MGVIYIKRLVGITEALFLFRVLMFLNALSFSPDFKFQDHVGDSISQDEPPKKQILKRESASFDEVRRTAA